MPPDSPHTTPRRLTQRCRVAGGCRGRADEFGAPPGHRSQDACRRGSATPSLSLCTAAQRLVIFPLSSSAARGPELHDLRDHEILEAAGAVTEHLALRERRALGQRDHRLDRLAEDRVGHADDRGFGTPGRLWSTFSTSLGLTFSPRVLMMSSFGR